VYQFSLPQVLAAAALGFLDTLREMLAIQL
jgi:hypothetical protein